MSMTLNEGSYTQAEQARGTGAPPQRRNSLVRCAIYIHKSTDEGLDQDFNSLDAQRESAEAYILSHKNEGWVYLLERSERREGGAEQVRSAAQGTSLLRAVQHGHGAHLHGEEERQTLPVLCLSQRPAARLGHLPYEVGERP